MTLRPRTWAAGIVAATCLIASAAPAATVNFQGSAQGTNFLLSFSDDADGQIDVSITATADPNKADLLGLGFDFDANPAFEESDFVFVSSNTGEQITDVCFDTDKCGGGLNFEGQGQNIFDYIVRLGDNGTQGGNYLMQFAFSILTDATVDGLGALAIRAQSSGADGEGSIKLIDFTPVPVPVPAAGGLLLGALAVLGLMKRRKAA